MLDDNGFHIISCIIIVANISQALESERKPLNETNNERPRGPPTAYFPNPPISTLGINIALQLTDQLGIYAVITGNTVLPTGNYSDGCFICTLLQFACVSCFKYLDTSQTDAAQALAGLPSYTAKIADVPHHVLVYYARWYCSGSLVGSRTVVTCASCFFKRGGESIYVKVGTRQYLDNKSQRIGVIDMKIHEFYRRLTPVDNDIALLFLERNVKFSSRIMKIPLVEPDVSLRLGYNVYVSGYGAQNKFRHQLLRTTIKIVQDDVCRLSYGPIMSSSVYCGELYFKENPLSDNGGGATLTNVLVGILITGANSAHPNAAILTNVSYFHRWIVLNTQRYHQKHCNATKESEEIESYEDYGIALLKHRLNKLIIPFTSDYSEDN